MDILGIFVKQPVPGRVKTRLARDVGDERAAAVYAAFLADVIAQYRTAADRRFLCCAPDVAAALDHFRKLGGTDYELWPQPDGTLGERLERFFRDAFEMRAERVVVVGSDSPTLPAERVAEAFNALRRRDVVIGPATDGGYYLIGQGGRGHSLFRNIDWSGPAVLRQTVDQVEEAGATLELLPPWYDVDTLDDLQLLRGHLRAMSVSGQTMESLFTERELRVLFG